MPKKAKPVSDDHVTSLKALFADYVKMQQRVDAVNKDLKRFHTRITRVTLRALEKRKSV